MLDVNIKIITELKKFLEISTSDLNVLNHFRSSQRDFTRNRKLSFAHLVLFISKLCKKTLSVELDQFFETELTGSHSSCTVSAYSQQRNKLESSFSQVWNQVLYESFYHYGKQQTKRWKGYRVIAADGSSVSLISTSALASHFGGQSNQSGAYTGAKTLLHYDVLNKLVIYSNLTPYRTGELPMAHRAIDTLAPDTLTIYDRNFCNFKMVALHRWGEVERRFVIRAKESQKFIASFIKRGSLSEEVNMYPTDEAIIEMKKSGFIVTKKTALKVRLVRVDLPNGVTEVLITDLWENEGYGAELFKDLYFMRWGVETGISVLKNLLQLESFSGQTVKSVEQDFFATIFMANLSALIVRQAEEEKAALDARQAEEKKSTLDTLQAQQGKAVPDAPQAQKKQSSPQPVSGKRKMRNWPVQVNRNKATGKLREALVCLFTSARPDEILQHLSAYFRKHMLPVRKGRSFPRKIKNKQSKNKHKTFSNYKTSI